MPDTPTHSRIPLIAVFSVGIALLLSMRPVFAQESAGENEEPASEFELVRAAMNERRADAAAIERRLRRASGIMLEILRTRLENDRIELMELGLQFGEDIGSLPDEERSEELVQMAVEGLHGNLQLADSTWESLDSRTEVPAEDLSAAAQAEADRSFFAIQRDKDRILALTADTLAQLRGFDVDVTDAEAAFEERLRERAINASVYLDLALDYAGTVRAGLRAVPGDSELTARLAVADSRVSQIADSLKKAADRLDAIGVDTSSYRAQLLGATGEVTPEVFSVSVIRNLATRVGQMSKNWVVEKGPNLLFRALVFLIVLFVFSRLARLVQRVTKAGLDRSRPGASTLLRRTLVSVAGNVVLATGVLIAFSQAGVSVGTLLAGLGIAGVVVGLALQDTLSNFASGLMILFYRPFDVGDVVEIAGVSGTVDEMTLVNTTVKTFDNQTVVVPNKTIWGGVVRNVTAQKLRRVDMTFAISYRDDIEKTERILRELVTGHPMVLEDPEPTIRLHELADYSVKFVVRPWTRTEDYWNVYWDITRAVKVRFDQEGITIPLPQRDVRVINATAPQSATRAMTAPAPGERPE